MKNSSDFENFCELKIFWGEGEGAPRKGALGGAKRKSAPRAPKTLATPLVKSPKTQFLWHGSRQQPSEINTRTMTIGNTVSNFGHPPRLSVTFHSELGIYLYVNNITRSCFYQLRQLGSIRRSKY